MGRIIPYMKWKIKAMFQTAPVTTNQFSIGGTPFLAGKNPSETKGLKDVQPGQALLKPGLRLANGITTTDFWGRFINRNGGFTRKNWVICQDVSSKVVISWKFW